MGKEKLFILIKKFLKCLTPINININNVVLAPNNILNQKVAVVTGASRGIGKATAKAMISCGAVVVAVGRRQETLLKVKKEFKSDHFIPFRCDVSDVHKIDEYISSILSLIDGRNIDIFVHCAGVRNGNDERFFEYKPEDYDYVVDTNLKGTFFWFQAISQYMINRNIKGHIVNVISIKGFIGEASPYSISKWGSTSLTKGLARMLAPKGIVVNGIAPGGTATDMANFKEGSSMLHLATPSRRLADPNEIANTIVFLASDLGNNIVGDVIISDGGQILQYGNNLM
jgi:3-oxoacyl-[acyl-carrier protein] reductase